MPVTITRDPRVAFALPLAPTELRAALLAMLGACGSPDLPVELSLVDDTRIAAHNSRFLGCPGPTNILSFPAPEPVDNTAGESGETPAAALMLSVTTLHRECLLYGQPPAEHALRLLAHGVVHLLGHDHGEEMERLCRHAEEAGEAALAAYAG